VLTCVCITGVLRCVCVYYPTDLFPFISIFCWQYRFRHRRCFFLRQHDNSWTAALSLMKFCMNMSWQPLEPYWISTSKIKGTSVFVFLRTWYCGYPRPVPWASLEYLVFILKTKTRFNGLKNVLLTFMRCTCICSELCWNGALLGEWTADGEWFRAQGVSVMDQLSVECPASTVIAMSADSCWRRRSFVQSDVTTSAAAAAAAGDVVWDTHCSDAVLESDASLYISGFRLGLGLGPSLVTTRTRTRTHWTRTQCCVTGKQRHDIDFRTLTYCFVDVASSWTDTGRLISDTLFTVCCCLSSHSLLANVVRDSSNSMDPDSD